VKIIRFISAMSFKVI